MTEVQLVMHEASLGGPSEDFIDIALRLIGIGFGPEGDWCSKYGCDFENDVFAMSRYSWSDCDCGADDGEEELPHSPDCCLEKPNFHYKPTNFRLKWYKYIGRGMEANQDSVPGDFLLKVFESHPNGMTAQQALEKYIEHQREIDNSWAEMLEKLNSGTDPLEEMFGAQP